jgi:signal transduction histidine kinase
LRRRLAVLVAATMALVLVAFVVPLAVLVRAVAADRAVTTATSQAQSLGALVATADDRTLRLSVDQLNATAGHPVTVFKPDGTAVGATAARGDAVELAARGSSITVDVAGGKEVLVAVQGLPTGTAVVRTFVADAELTRGVGRAWLILALLGLVLLALGVAVADRLVVAVVRPIGELARVSHRLAGGDLDARADRAGPPEVRGVAAALNHLAGRIREFLWHERESVADLSHRLRTPLTALRLEVDAAALDRDRIAAQIRAVEHAVTTLIEDARRRTDGPESCDAVAVVAARAAFWSVLAEDQGRALTVDLAPGPLPVRAGAADLGAAVDALLGNVFSHTPEGTAFGIAVTARPEGGAQVTVADRGPGFANPSVPARGTSGGGSTGLGLDIARQTAESSGGRFVVASASPGAVITIELGPP